MDDKDPETGKRPLSSGENESLRCLYPSDQSAALPEEGLQAGGLLRGRPVRRDDPFRGEIREALRSVLRRFSAELPPGCGKTVQGADG